MSSLFFKKRWRTERIKVPSKAGLFHWRYRQADYFVGRQCNYPICCILRFSLALYDAQAGRRGLLNLPGRSQFIPCNMFHKGEPYPHPCTNEELRIRRFKGM